MIRPGLSFFFFKQKTAYEMVGSDWSSDVCSSDLAHAGEEAKHAAEDVVVEQTWNDGEASQQPGGVDFRIVSERRAKIEPPRASPGEPAAWVREARSENAGHEHHGGPLRSQPGAPAQQADAQRKPVDPFVQPVEEHGSGRVGRRRAHLCAHEVHERLYREEAEDLYRPEPRVDAGCRFGHQLAKPGEALLGNHPAGSELLVAHLSARSALHLAAGD